MMIVPLVFYLIIALLLRGKIADAVRDLQTDIALDMDRENNRFLSRQRRYIMFPEGSSFQLVFCLTYSSVGVGSYFVFGHTAALAYELPTSKLYYDRRDFENKDDDTGETTTTEMPEVFDISDLDHSHSENEQMGSEDRLWRVSDEMDKKYPRNNFIGPGYYSNPLAGPYNNNIWNYGISKFNNVYSRNFKPHSFKNPDNYHPYPRYDSSKSHMSFNMHPKYHEVHRRTRRDLYRKLEGFLATINLDGKACVLKAICEIHTAPSKNLKGTLVEEMFKAIFKSKPHDNHTDEDDYDAAANPKLNCTDVFKTCQGSIRNIQLLTRK
ncbi:uncharacterized protein LOC109546138 [Dendroctonus ponderosae]|uniref:uncharacterized protein LOC109546138 n=1 Tax=Dendroctonus ponderosae TaxID=77166 RepID=UPI002035D825|nr:uncharacterized protein LOC109546138 [Dendroctonus ponderosae]